MGKVHGSLARAGKVKGQTPKVAKQEDKKKTAVGRAKKRAMYNKRFINVVPGMKKGPNSQTTMQPFLRLRSRRARLQAGGGTWGF